MRKNIIAAILAAVLAACAQPMPDRGGNLECDITGTACTLTPLEP